MRADEVAHVLDHAGDIHLHLAEHLNRLARVLQRHVGWSRNHDCARERNGLHQGQRNVSCARRKIDDHVIEFSPFDQAEKLADDLVQHGTAPDNGLVAGIEKSDGDDFQAERFNGLDAVFTDHARLGVHSKHQRDVGAVDVGVEQANFVSHFGECNGQIHRQRGLAHASLTGTNCDDGVDAGQWLRALLRWTWSVLMRCMCVQRITLQKGITKMR